MAKSAGTRSEDWFRSNCMGVVTKIDKKLEPKLESAEVYDKKFADYVKKLLDCDFPDTEHLSKMDWCVVLNPNPHEQLNGMSFAQAYQKEKWFFEQLFPTNDPHHPDHAERKRLRSRCAIGGFRTLLVNKYEKFAANICKQIAPEIFKLCLEQEIWMRDRWGWTVEEECYESTPTLLGVLQRTVGEICGKAWSDEFQPARVLTKKKRTRAHLDGNAERQDPNEQVKKDMMKPITNLAGDIQQNLDQVVTKDDERPEYWRYTRFPMLISSIQAAVDALLQKLVSHADEVSTAACDIACKINALKKSTHAGFWDTKAMGPKNLCMMGVLFEM
jgi:hypothetical protein